MPRARRSPSRSRSPSRDAPRRRARDGDEKGADANDREVTTHRRRDANVAAHAAEDGEIAPAPARASAPGPSATGKLGGAYVPPFKLARMLAKAASDPSSVEYQRATWDALKKSINGLVNKLNASNVQDIVRELFGENLIRGRGVFARSVMKSQMASPRFSGIFAALVAVVNTKFPEIGELIIKRCILQFRRAYKRNDKPVCVAATKFLAAFVNQQVRDATV